MKINIFYSWQSDKQNTVIQDATQLAIERIVSDDEFAIDAALDRDTKDIPGSPAIAEAILSKIDRCGLFLCDVTIVTKSTSKRKSPNPNVLIELGYAAARVGRERIICVMNEIYGEPKELPFDIQHRRWPIRYKLANDATEAEIIEARDGLSQNIELAIRSALQSGIITASINPKDSRVAVKLSGAMSNFTGTLATFLISHKYEDGMKIILRDYPDEPGSNYPSPTVVDPILSVLANNTLKSPSHARIGERQLSWAEIFINDLVQVSQNCNRILDQYADRDDTLISLVDEVNNRAEMLASMISTCITAPELSTFYDNGVPENHLKFYRYFLLAILKSYRVVRQFGVKVQ